MTLDPASLPDPSRLEVTFVIVQVFLFKGVVIVVGVTKRPLGRILVDNFFVVDVLVVVWQRVVLLVQGGVDVRQETEARGAAQVGTASRKWKRDIKTDSTCSKGQRRPSPSTGLPLTT